MDYTVKKRGLAYKLGIFLCLITKNVNNTWCLLFSWFMFSSAVERVRTVSSEEEASARLPGLYG